MAREVTYSVIDSPPVRLQPLPDLEQSGRHSMDDLSFSRRSDVEQVVAVLGGDVDQLVDDLLDRSDVCAQLISTWGISSRSVGLDGTDLY